MKKAISIIITIVILLTLCACQPKTEVKWLETSVTQEYIGTLTFRTETEYDENGLKTMFIQYTDGEEISRVEYTYTDNEIIGKTTQNGETGIIRQKYETDDSGNITKLEMYVDDVLYSVTENTYNEAGNILTSAQDSFFTGRSRITTTCTYDDAGNCIRINYNYGDGIGPVVENTFDEEGILISSINFDPEGNITRQEEHTQGDDGVEIIRILEPEVNRISVRYDTKDEHGNLLLSETYDENGELMVRVTYTYERFEIPVK